MKFARLHRYHAADYLYLVTTAGLIESHEVPSGWGWLELPESGRGLVLRAAPLRHVTSPGVRMAWLESVALSGGRAHLQSLPPPDHRRGAGGSRGTERDVEPDLNPFAVAAFEATQQAVLSRTVWAEAI
ncbi:MAG: hypothetical protein U1F61_20095 [Opitutaceae bacterium]